MDVVPSQLYIAISTCPKRLHHVKYIPRDDSNVSDETRDIILDMKRPGYVPHTLYFNFLEAVVFFLEIERKGQPCGAKGRPETTIKKSNSINSLVHSYGTLIRVRKILLPKLPADMMWTKKCGRTWFLLIQKAHLFSFPQSYQLRAPEKKNKKSSLMIERM
jgi:hypothetical protein